MTVNTIEIYRDIKQEKSGHSYYDRETTTYEYFKITPSVDGNSNLKLIGRELTLLGESSDKDLILPYKIHDVKVASIIYQGKQFFRLRSKEEFAHDYDYYE